VQLGDWVRVPVSRGCRGQAVGDGLVRGAGGAGEAGTRLRPPVRLAATDRTRTPGWAQSRVERGTPGGPMRNETVAEPSGPIEHTPSALW
jgi:hypothetical protein